jgi:hypothetical protein
MKKEANSMGTTRKTELFEDLSTKQPRKIICFLLERTVYSLNLRNATLATCTLFLVLFRAYGQPDVPILTERYAKEPKKADFVIVLDRSGSMQRFWPSVIRSVGDFIEVLPDGDYVSILFFEGRAGELVTPREITTASRTSLREQLAGLGRPQGARTDLGAGINRTLEELNRPAANRLQFVFFFTDFEHDPPTGSPWSSRDPLTRPWRELQQKKIRFVNEQRKLLKVYALRLPLTANVGRDMRLFESVFDDIELVTVTDHASLRAWFERRRAEIHRDRLRLLIGDAIKEEIKKMFHTSLSGTNEVMLQVRWNDAQLADKVEITSFKLSDVKVESSMRWEYERLPMNAGKETPELILARGWFESEPWIQRRVPFAAESHVRLKVNFEPKRELHVLNIDASQVFDLVLGVEGQAVYGKIPVGIAGTVIGIVILFFSVSAWTCFRPLSIHGQIQVLRPAALPLRYTVVGKKSISIGNVDTPNTGLNVPGTNWLVTLRVRRNCPARLWKKAGVYASLERGASAIVISPTSRKPQQISRGQEVLVSKGTRIEISELGQDYTIMWQ